MGRIEDIARNCEITKEHIQRMDEQKLGFHIMSYQRDYVDHVSNLLSRLQIAEESLIEIKAYTEWAKDEHRQNNEKIIYIETVRALEQIRRD